MRTYVILEPTAAAVGAGFTSMMETSVAVFRVQRYTGQWANQKIGTRSGHRGEDGERGGAWSAMG